MTLSFRQTVSMLFTVAVMISLIACGGKKQSNDGNADTPDDTLSMAAPSDSVTVELTGMDSLSVFELLQKSHAVDYHPTALGVFVTGIDSLENNSNHYWVYSVNDSFPQIASDKYLTATGDRVVWHYRNSR